MALSFEGFTRELSESFGKGTKNTHDYEKFNSVSGRGLCGFKVMWHAAGMVYKPFEAVARLVVSVFRTIASVFGFTGKNTMTHMWETSYLVGGIFLAPVMQLAKVGRAAAGIIHPGAYYTNGISPVLVDLDNAD